MQHRQSRPARLSRPAGQSRAARQTSRLAVPVVVLAAVSTGLAACSASPGGNGSPGSVGSAGSGGASVVTPSAARALVAPTMATNNRANANLDSHLLASYESGSAFTLDDAAYLADRQARFRPPSSPFTIDLTRLGLARQSTWPAQFLAAGTQKPLRKGAPKSASCGALLDFQRTAASGAWKIVLEPTVNANALPHLATSSGGYSARVSVATQRTADAVPGRMVNALMAEETSGHLGPFKRSDFTGNCWQIPNPRLDVVDAEASGYSQRDLFTTAAPADTAAFSLAGGGTLVLFTLRFDEQLIASTPSRPVTWTHASLSKNPGAAWTYFLAAGRYAQVIQRGQLEVAVDLAAGSKDLHLVGSYSGITSVTGTKAKATGTIPGGTLTAFGAASG